MVQKQLKVVFYPGIHARASAKVVQCVSKYISTVYVWNTENNERKNARSILDMLMLGAIQGADVVFCVNGPDENEVIEELERLFSNDFDL